MAQFSKQFRFEKRGPDQTLFGVVYAHSEIDSQGDFAKADDLKYAVEYLSESSEWPRVIDLNHAGDVADAKVIESYTAKQNGSGYKAGDWLVSVRVGDSLWPKIEAGDYEAFSISGAAQREKTSLNGQDAYRLSKMKIDKVSLVKRGANRKKFVAKSDTPAWVKRLTASFDALAERLDRIDGITKADQNPDVGDFVKQDGRWYKVIGKTNNQTAYRQVEDSLVVALEKQARRVRRASEARRAKAKYGTRPGDKQRKRIGKMSNDDIAELKQEYRQLHDELFRIMSHGGELNKYDDARVDKLHADILELESLGIGGAGDFDLLENSDAHAYRNRNNPLRF